MTGIAPGPPDAAPLELLAAAFRAFDVGDPLYAAICPKVAARPEWLSMLWRAPRGQQLPNLWLAALHDRILAGAERAGEQAGDPHPLAAYFESVGGRRAPDAALADALADFVGQEQAVLLESIATRTTQTNEIGRCAVLRPALAHIVRASGTRELALLDFGCSAGLNLGVDRYAYADAATVEVEVEIEVEAEVKVKVAPAAIPTIACRRVGPVAWPPDEPAPRIVDRLGIDPAPVDVNDARALRWLRACIWPGDRERDRRLLQAAALMRTERWPVHREADGLAAVDVWLDRLPRGVLPVVFHSWVLHYVDAAGRARHAAKLDALVRERGVWWLAAEGPHVRIGGTDAPAPFEATIDAAMTTLWTLGSSARQGRPRFELLARSHAHGRWVEWLAPAAATLPG